MRTWCSGHGHLAGRAQGIGTGSEENVVLLPQRLVHALGTDSWACYPLLTQLLPYCTDINQVWQPSV